MFSSNSLCSSPQDVFFSFFLRGSVAFFSGLLCWTFSSSKESSFIVIQTCPIEYVWKFEGRIGRSRRSRARGVGCQGSRSRFFHIYIWGEGFWYFFWGGVGGGVAFIRSRFCFYDLFLLGGPFRLVFNETPKANHRIMILRHAEVGCSALCRHS